MAHRSGDVAAVRSVCSRQAQDGPQSTPAANEEGASAADNDRDRQLPQCKIKRNYSCTLCPFFSQNPRSFLYHSRDVHLDRIKIYECSQCLYASKHSQKLQRHIKMIHVNGKNRIRRVARPTRAARKREQRQMKPKMAGANRSTRRRRAIEENQGNDLSSVPMEECENDDDDDQFVDEEELFDRDMKCSACSFLTRSPSLMLRHERVVHFKKRFLRCSKCTYVTHIKARFTKHVKYHTMPMIKCDLCDFRTPYKWNLDRHYKNHCGTGAFKCAKCNFRADIKQSLTVHEMNHHIPPVGQGAVMVRRKNKVGASETLSLESENIDKEELELLRMEREDSELVGTEEIEPKEDGGKMQEKRITGKRNLHHLRNLPLPCKRESVNHNLQTDFIHPDDIVPRYGQIYVKTLKCRFCNYKAVFAHEITRHEKRIHNYVQPEPKKAKLAKRPPPKLIPLQNRASSTSTSSPILKIPLVRNKVPVLDTNVKVEDPISPSDKSVNEKEFKEMCKKSCLTSSLKDFVSLIGDEEGLKTIPDPQGDIDLENETSTVSREDEVENSEEANKKKQTDLLKKKNASFFDKLKEKLLTSTSENINLICDCCGYESKCLSEAVAHQKRHSGGSRSDSEGQAENDNIPTGAVLSPTRCQHCRQRCKTNTDLINHLKSCKAVVAASDQQPEFEESPDIVMENEDTNDECVQAEEDSNSTEKKVFVWNDVPRMYDNLEEDVEMEEAEVDDPGIPCNQEDNGTGMEGVEGTDSTHTRETDTIKAEENTESDTFVSEYDPNFTLSIKKVFKCPHCSFWASTASRFHVHIVGHLNKKPFECSLCMYRSNWRWDITKHIRLKSARDPSHSDAKVNMTDETGRRNYSKYNKYLTMMRVPEPSADSSGTGRRSRNNDLTQGIARESDIIRLPAPPSLTRAPAPGTGQQVPQGTPIRPPPPLKVGHRAPTSATKKTLWKCKKCNLRGPSKDLVLAHVKEHYGKTASDSASKAKSPVPEDAEEPSGSPSLFHKNPPFRCGHCHQVSNWKHVIQRHCRLKHNGYVLIELDWKDDSNGKQLLESDMNLDTQDSSEISLDTFSCDICPFTTDSEGDLTAHKLNHVDRPGSIFKCTYCPFYVPSKIAVLEHMEVHGIERGLQLPPIKLDKFEPNDYAREDPTKNKANDAEQKKFKCRQCPYVSNSKTQFLYHKQFHKPRKSLFKCMYCSYNVSRRHLLHQHLKLHDNFQKPRVSATETRKPDSPPAPLVEIDTPGTAEEPRNPTPAEIDTPGAAEEPCNSTPAEIDTPGAAEEPDDPISSAEIDSPAAAEELDDPIPTAEIDTTRKAEVSHYPIPPAKVATTVKAEVSHDPIPRAKVATTRKVEVSHDAIPRAKVATSRKAEVPHDAIPRAKVATTVKAEVSHYPIPRAKVATTAKAEVSHYPIPRAKVATTVKAEVSHCPIPRAKVATTAKAKVPHDPIPRAHIDTSGTAEVPHDPIPPVEIDTSGMAEVPLVWVFKSGNFQKMYKCRWCPHVNARKINIQEHEKMHRTVGKKGVDASSYKLKCPNCNYMCNNAGVLSSHAKVHQGFFGEIRSLVDSKRTDAEQIQELQNALRFVEPEVVISVDEDSENETTVEKRKQTGVPQKTGRLCRNSNQERYTIDPNVKALNFCNKCPARFFIRRELRIHSKFHVIQSIFRCPHCTYTARQKAHLLSHYRVHTGEYQRRTAELVASYPISSDNPRLKTVIVARSSDVIEGPVYMLQNCTSDKGKQDPKSRAKYPCDKCPAKFFKSVALQYHLTLHGGAHQHKCKYCDYAVKTLGNLMRHQLVHEEEDKKSLVIPKVEECMESEMMDQEDEEQLDGEGITSSVSTRSESWNRRKMDPQFGTLIQGSPKFIYPTYRKNGKIREKRYKCHKCPSAFEKREQYKIHLSLHGSKQKYRCEKCDYSVKYYANYVQHVRKHKSHDEALEKMKSKGFEDAQDTLNHDMQEELAVPGEGENNNQAYELSLMEQQTLMLQEKKKQAERENERKFFSCSYCPYLSNRRDAVDNHTRRHYSVSGIKSNFQCMYCDYSATQGNFLKEHIKLHFNNPVQHKPEAYLKCEKMELWYMEDNGEDEEDCENKVLFFKDNGEGCEERFYPPIPPNTKKDDRKYPTIYVNPETGEIVAETVSMENRQENYSVKAYENPVPHPMETVELRQENLVVAVEEQLDKKIEEQEAAKADAAAKKRWRGKNWKCKKCPHAFNKRDQYLRHASLHGSNQRHNCDLCDYSVKFYTNYVQHMKMHQMHEPNRVILVKKNFRSESNANKAAKEASSGPGAELFMNAMEEAGYYESDSVMSQAEEKFAVEQCGETDHTYSSSTDAMEASASSDDAACQEMRRNSLGLGPDVSAFVKYETDAS